MNTLASVLKNQPSYAMDVDKIFTRLHHDQSLPKMNDLFEHIFTESSQSILEDYADQTQQSFDEKSIKNYHDTSLMLFKNKLMMIVQMTIENIHNSTLQKDLNTARQPNQNQTSESMLDEKAHHELNTTKLGLETDFLNSAKSTIETEPIEKLKVSQKSISPVKKAKRAKDICSPSSSKTVKEVSYVLRPNRVTSSKKRLDSTNNTTIKYSDTSSRYDPQCSPVSKSPSLLNAILSPVIQQNAKSHRNFDRTLSRNSSPNQTILNPSILTNRQNLNFSMAISHRQPLNNSQSFVQSEFNYIRGPATFSGAPRTSWVDVVSQTESPGPALYNPQITQIRSRSPSPTIGKAQKVSWVDEVAHTESPGPAKYNPIMRSRSPSPTIPKAEKISWVDVVSRTDSPGPARYHPILKSRSPSPTIGKAVRTSWVDVVAKTDSPGPAAHYGSHHFLSK